MTTLNVRMSALRTAVAPYPVVKDLQVRTQFPHGLRIHVIEQVPIAAVTAAGRAIAVAADGTLLRDITPAPSLPVIPLPAPPGGPRLTDAAALAAVALVAAAPSPLLAKISQVTDVQSHGLTAQVRGGPSIYFGDATAGDAKWAAAAAVLADPGSAGATYIDVTDPHRPVAGAPAPQQTSAAAQPATTTSTGSG
jgi:cell division septal protein FtsQ